MDIKGIVRNLNPLQLAKSSETARAHKKSDADNDREGNGQAATGEEQKRRPMTPEELVEAVKYLEGLTGVKDNGLRVRLESKDGINVVYVEDGHGSVVRRIPESDLLSLTSNRDRKSGHLLNKAL